MARGPRIDVGDVPFHVINRANARAQIFHTDSDYKDFEYLLSEIKETFEMRILAYAIMPNHWHLLLYPRKDGDLGKSMQWLATSHALRHHVRMKTIGEGHLYQGRYKSFPIQEDEHLLTVLKYIERNPVRAGLCKRAEEWKWGSAYRRIAEDGRARRLLDELPTDFPKNYLNWINTSETSEDLDEVRKMGIYPGLAPFGYINNPLTKTVVVHRKNAQLLKKTFEMYATGKFRLDQLAELWEKSGVMSRGNRRIHISRLSFILQNPFYYGHFRYGGELFEGKHEPIISKALYNSEARPPSFSVFAYHRPLPAPGLRNMRASLQAPLVG